MSDKGASLPGAFKMSHFPAVEPILSPNFSQLFHFLRGEPVLINPAPRVPIMRKRNQIEEEPHAASTISNRDAGLLIP